MTEQTKFRETGSTNLYQDPVDLRDRIYQPTLNPLPPNKEPPAFFSACDSYHVRQQYGDSCTGNALAALIDIHRQRVMTCPIVKSEDPASAQNRASAMMLYKMALRQENRMDEQGVMSLRSVVKGFYHFGVCPESLWDDSATVNEPTPQQAIKAKKISLGSYYRLHPYLNDYHAAINEADAILVSATIHNGWNQLSFDDGRPYGTITDSQKPLGNHAFLVVGYNEEGFIVFNSWGPKWGGVHKPGLALWPYDDWSESILDAWVLRLGVPAGNSFSSTIGRQGINFDGVAIGADHSGSPPCHLLLGHFSHLRDGQHAQSGSYVSSREAVKATANRIGGKDEKETREKRLSRQRDGRDMLLYVPGSTFDIKRAVAHEIANRGSVEKNGFYPYTLFWANDDIETANEVLGYLFDKAVKKVGGQSNHLNSTIERVAAGQGRAFWRDLKSSAERAAQENGDAADIFNTFAAVENLRLHLIIDGAGALLFDAYLRNLNEEKKERFLSSVKSLDLITPTLEFHQLQGEYANLISRLSGNGDGNARLWTPSVELERRLHVGAYTNSILHLVLYSFEGRTKPMNGARIDLSTPNSDAVYVGMSSTRIGLQETLDQSGDPRLAGLSLETLEITDPDRRHYTQADITMNANVHRAIIRKIIEQR